MRKALALAAIIAASPASAQVYKWTDENGVTHFGSQPPPGQRNEQVEVDAPEPGRPSSGQSSIARQVERMERERDLRRLEQARDRLNQQRQQVEADRPDYVCQGAKDRLKSYEREWEDIKRQGYSVSQQNRWERRIQRQRDHVDNICR